MAAYTLGWKVEEPAPPLASNEDDLWLFPEDNVKANVSDPNNFGTLSKRELAEQLLEDIDSIVKNEENDTFSDWIEETIDLHLFDEVQPVVPAEESKSETENTVFDSTTGTSDFTPLYTPGDTSDSCFDLNYDTLNPVNLPIETTPDCSYQTLSNLVLTPDENLAETQILPDQPGLSAENTSSQPSDQSLATPPTPVPDLEKEMELVEEVVRRTAQAVGNHHIVIWEFKLSNRRRVRSSSHRSADSDDSEWLPPNRKKAKSPRKRSKPYERPKNQEDRLNRKKEQNKNAAIRYRQRKKAELRDMLKEEKTLEQKRDKLKIRLAELQMEIKYLKSIMRDLFMGEVN